MFSGYYFELDITVLQLYLSKPALILSFNIFKFVFRFRVVENGTYYPLYKGMLLISLYFIVVVQQHKLHNLDPRLVCNYSYQKIARLISTLPYFGRNSENQLSGITGIFEAHIKIFGKALQRERETSCQYRISFQAYLSDS